MHIFGLVVCLLVTLYFWGLVFIKKEFVALLGAISFTVLSGLLIYLEQPFPIG